MGFHDYVGIRRASRVVNRMRDGRLRKDLRAVIRMRAGEVGVSQMSPSLPLQCRQCRIRGRDRVPYMQLGCGFYFW
jgi:hypothetical protein